jgi:hypothetical protein
MDTILIHNTLSGTKNHLRNDPSGFAITHEILPDDWIVGNEDAVRSVDIVSQIFDEQLPRICDAAHLTAFKALNLDEDNPIPWHLVLSKEEFKNRISRIMTSSNEVLKKLKLSNYEEIFVQNRRFLKSLSKASINLEKLENYLRDSSDNPTRASTLKTFLPGADEFADTINYDQTATVTGRLTVKSGPRVLTQPAETRDIFKSRYTCGTVFSVDFISLEPRVIRKIMFGDETPIDIYQHVQDLIGNKTLARNEIKRLIISCIYGASKQRLNSMSKISNLSGAMITIDDYFGIERLNQKLQQCHSDNGHIVNYFGRPVFNSKEESHLWISHYVQSTAVDVALDGFSKMSKDLSRLDKDIVPFAVIHDAVLFDVPSKSNNLFVDYTNEQVMTRLGQFPVSRTEISRRADV